MSSKKRFSQEEDNILRQKYASATKAELMALLPERKSWESIRMRAFKLGLKRSKEARSYEMGKPLEGNFTDHLTEAEKGYIAGLIDGEGSITLSRRVSGRVNPVYSIHISICNTSPKLIEWLNGKFPGKAYTYPRNKSRLGSKPVYAWVVAGNRQCIQFLKEIVNYLVIKRPQAELLIGGYVHLEPKEREELWMKLKQLKKEL